MLYMVEMRFTAPERLDEWNRWYDEHLGVLLSVPGLSTSQRFRYADGAENLVAIYTVESDETLKSEGYTKVAGPRSVGDFKPHIVDWRRNVYDGMARAPVVAPNQLLVLIEGKAGEEAAAGLTVTWLNSVHLDRSPERRGMLVVGAEDAALERLAKIEGIRIFAPMMDQRIEE